MLNMISLLPLYLKRLVNVFELLARRNFAIDVIPRVSCRNEHWAHVLVPTLKVEELLHKANVLSDKVVQR